MRQPIGAGALCGLAILLGLAAFVAPSPASTTPGGVVWLIIDAEEEGRRTQFRAPLEWLAEADRGLGNKDSSFNVEGIRFDPVELWARHKSLKAGERVEIGRGRTKEGVPYQLRLAGERASQREAKGKLHILARDEDGEVLDLRFPLGVPRLLSWIFRALASMQFEGAGSPWGEKSVDPSPDLLEKLGAYGPFILLEVKEKEPLVRIAVE